MKKLWQMSKVKTGNGGQIDNIRHPSKNQKQNQKQKYVLIT